MLRKSLIVALGFLGVLLVGTAAGRGPASAGYACGPWNKWCATKFWAYPGYHYGWYGHGHKKWGKSHAYKHWNKGKNHSHKGKHWKKYH